VLLLFPLVCARVLRAEGLDLRLAAAAFASLLLVPVLVFALLAPLLWIYRVRVHPLGLRVYDGYGRFFSVRWASVLEVQRLDLLSLPYLGVRTTEVRVRLVVPLFLTRQTEFERQVAELAGPLNPLTRYFRERGSASPERLA
jgi:hypothetical protein